MRPPWGGWAGETRPLKSPWSPLAGPRIENQAAKTHAKIDQIFQSIFNDKMHPKWVQNQPQNPSKNHKNNNHFLHRVWLSFWMHFGIIFDPPDPWFLSSRPHEVLFFTVSRFRKTTKNIKEIIKKNLQNPPKINQSSIQKSIKKRSQKIKRKITKK